MSSGYAFTRCQFLIELGHRIGLVSKISVVIRSGSGMLVTFAGLFHVLDLREATCTYRPLPRLYLREPFYAWTHLTSNLQSKTVFIGVSRWFFLSSPGKPQAGPPSARQIARRSHNLIADIEPAVILKNIKKRPYRAF